MVPLAVAELLRNGLIPDPYKGSNVDSVQWIENEDWNYKRTIFATDTLLKHGHLDLVFKGLDTFAEVNRLDASAGREEPLSPDDLKLVFATMRDFLTSKTRGMEQLYEIMRHRNGEWRGAHQGQAARRQIRRPPPRTAGAVLARSRARDRARDSGEDLP